jgi:hypothetical protein
LARIEIQCKTGHPQAFAGRSLSKRDVVVLVRDGKASAYYIDSFKFEEVPEFLEAPYRYYSTQRPVDIGTFPKTDSGPANVVNYDKREDVENATFKAWGYLAYDAPLTDKQISDYELRAASDNPDRVMISPYQLAEQIQYVGIWEIAKHVSDIKRMTWYHNDFGVFARKEHVAQERITERYEQIIEAKNRTAEKRTAKENQIQVVGQWEDIKGLPDNERYTWFQPSRHAYSLREPDANSKLLENRFVQAKDELTRNTKKPIAEQLKENNDQAARDNAGRQAPPTSDDKREDR